ncbi:hypothetical protein PENTCL1PPCAC_1482, partial [Pristionchus entomophagus]
FCRNYSNSGTNSSPTSKSRSFRHSSTVSPSYCGRSCSLVQYKRSRFSYKLTGNPCYYRLIFSKIDISATVCRPHVETSSRRDQS